MTTGDVTVYNYREWENTDRSSEGWWTMSVPASGTADSVVHPFAAQNVGGGGRNVQYIARSSSSAPTASTPPAAPLDRRRPCVKTTPRPVSSA